MSIKRGMDNAYIAADGMQYKKVYSSIKLLESVESRSVPVGTVRLIGGTLYSSVLSFETADYIYPGDVSRSFFRDIRNIFSSKFLIMWEKYDCPCCKCQKCDPDHVSGESPEKSAE